MNVLYKTTASATGGRTGQAATADGALESFSFLTTEAGPDVAAYHDRQPVVLEREHYAGWLEKTLPLEAVARPPKGLLNAVKA